MPLPVRTRTLAAGLGLACAGLTVAALPASATGPKGGSAEPASLAAVLTADGNTFDRKALDHDVLTQAVLAVLEAKPSSPVSVLTQARTPVTAFLPNDRAFARLVKDLTGTKPASEEAAFRAVAGLGIDTVETVLLYHVVPGATLTAKDALAADGTALTTAQGGTVTVRVPVAGLPLVTLVDADRDDRNPLVVRFDINKGAPQIAHGVSAVLRPVDL